MYLCVRVHRPHYSGMETGTNVNADDDDDDLAPQTELIGMSNWGVFLERHQLIHPYSRPHHRCYRRMVCWWIFSASL